MKLINGDCLEELKKFEDKSIDLVLTDPPYGINIAANPFRQKHSKSDWDANIPTKEYFDEILRVSKDQVIFGGNYFELPPCRGFFIWDKKQSEKFSSAMCEYVWSSRNAPAKIFRKHPASFPKFHPTTKPTDMIEWILGWFPNANTIMDPFMGSGTTGVACKSLNRDFIGIELDKNYFNIAKERIESSKAA